MSNPNITEVSKGTQFSATNQPENAGRKKNVLTYLKEDFNLSQSDIDNIINYISMMSISEYKDLIDKIKNNDESIKSMPVIMLKFVEAYGKAKINDVITILRASGKATEKRDVSGDINIKVEYDDTEEDNNTEKDS